MHLQTAQVMSAYSKAQSILLITHQRPDGDACGSLLSMYHYVSQMGKEIGVYVFDKPASYFDFLPHSQVLGPHEEVLSRHWDVVVVLDASNWDHTRVPDAVIERFKLNSKIIIFDHHLSNMRYGDINYLDVTASSACEVLFNFFADAGVTIDRHLATTLLCGVITDTGFFINAATSEKVFEVTAQLVRAGANIHNMVSLLNQNLSIADLKLWGLVLSRLTVNKKYGLVYTYLDTSEAEQFDASETALDNFTGLLQSLYGYNVMMFIKITPDQTKVSLRTRRDDVDVSRLAQIFGGGGHQKASGFAVPYRLVIGENGLQLPS